MLYRQLRLKSICPGSLLFKECGKTSCWVIKVSIICAVPIVVIIILHQPELVKYLAIFLNRNK